MQGTRTILSPLELMAFEEVRVANEAGRAVAVLSADLADVWFANSQAETLLGLAEADEGGLRSVDHGSVLGRQLAALVAPLAANGEAMGRVRRPGSAGPGSAATIHVFLADAGHDDEIAILSAPALSFAPEPREVLVARLFREATRRIGGCLLLDATGPLIRSADLSEEGAAELVPTALEFLRSGEAYTLSGPDRDGGVLTFARIASDLVLVHREEDEADEDKDDGEAEPGAGSEAAASRIGASAAIGGLVDGWHRRLSEPASIAVVPGEPAAAFVPDFAAQPARFVWQTDEEGRFRSISPEFAAAVGPEAANVLGLRFGEIARAFGFEREAEEIEGLIERRDTWSGRSIHWPVENSDRKVLVDLAALPTYDAARSFGGFRGFGVVRLGEWVPDPDALGRRLGSTDIHVAEEIEAEDFAAFDDDDPMPGDEEGEALAGAADELSGPSRERETEAVARDLPFGRRTRRPAADEAPRTPAADRRSPRERPLSQAEADAFAAIGAELGTRDGSTAATLVSDGEMSALLGALPLAVLFQVREQPVQASRAFFELTGFPDIPGFVAAGGLDALFSEDPAVGECVSLRGADGAALRAKVQIQRLTLGGRSCLAFFFTPLPEPEAPPPVEDPAPELRAEIAELRSVLDTATDGIMLLDRGGNLRSMNGSAQALFGLGPEEHRQRHLAELFAPESRQVASDYLEMLRDGGLAGILNDGREVVGAVAQGGTVPLFMTIGRLADERGWCVVLRDIAHWKRTEEELVAARRGAEDASLHKSRFLANISHELRTPLNAIIGFAEVMASECFGPIGHERYLEYLGDIKRSGHHVLDLVNDLLDISKIEAGKVELSFEAVSLNEVVSEVVSLMQPQASRGRVIVRSNLPATTPPVVADRRSLRQIALNLVANAIRFTPAGGQIVASTSYAPSGEVVLRFRDSGIGMTEREVEIALTPFQQVNAANRERGEGTGLGLPLTKAMVEANRAQFAIASAPGEGTVIEITFPSQRVLAD